MRNNIDILYLRVYYLVVYKLFPDLLWKIIGLELPTITHVSSVLLCQHFQWLQWGSLPNQVLPNLNDKGSDQPTEMCYLLAWLWLLSHLGLLLGSRPCPFLLSCSGDVWLHEPRLVFVFGTAQGLDLYQTSLDSQCSSYAYSGAGPKLALHRETCVCI